ncbi:MAG: exo-alpha-sialidase [Bacteroidaceae bacterium]|nr:exo-alpha-sialidase [Bacteroidaceae bacterium]
MKIKERLITLLLLVAGAVAQVCAQTAVTVGNQVTDVSNIVSGKAYLLRWDGLTGTPYALDAGGSNYGMANNNSATQAAVYYLISDGNGGYKIENAYTGKYWPTPSSNGQVMAPTTAASAGTWTIAASETANRFTFTCGSYHTNRSSSQLVAHTSDSPVSIYEVTGTLSTSSTYSTLSGKDISVSSTAAASISEGQWYVMSQRSRTSYVFENTSDHELKHTQTAPSGSATEKAGYLVRLLSAADGKYYLQNGYGNYMGAIAASTNVPTTALGEEALTVAKIASTDGHFYLQGTTNSVILDGNDFTGGDPSTVVGYGTSAPSSTGGNNDWAFYPVEFVDSWAPTASEVYTIANTSSRGNLTYDPTVNSYYVWSSGKSGATAFDATSANCQWVLYPTGTSGQYYLYNVGAGKFAVPSGIASGAGNAWYFSNSAVAVVLEAATGGYKIKAATNPVSGTNAAYMSVSNSYTGPIINYDDAGSIFAFTQVTGDESTAAAAAVGKLVKNASTALTAYPQTSGWYVLQIKSASSNTASVGRYVKPMSSLYNNLYPLTYTGSVDMQPAIDDATFFMYIDCRAWDDNDWQMPDGRYLVCNSNNKFPTRSNTASAFYTGYDGGVYIKSSNNYYADSYVNSGNYFIGETTTFRTKWNLYPINLTTAGLVDWKVLITSDGTTPVYDKAITCTRSDVTGLTSVYTGGHFFLPTGVTPTDADFSMSGATSFTIDDTNHTITANFDPNLAILASDVTVAQGWQTAGRSSDVYLLRVTANPFQDATGASLTVSLKDGTENQISSLTLYEADSSSPEVLGTGSGVPTLTQLNTTTIDGSSSTATLSIGSLTAGTHYYWLKAAVKSTATLGAVLDAAVTSLTYTCNSNETTLDLSSVGDPSDRGAMVFNVHSYPFLPRDNGSRVYRIPAMVVADDGSIVVACDKRYDSHTDIGNGHVIDIVIRRSTDGGQTWSAPVVIAKGQGSADNAKCGYGDPSLVKGKDGKLYCLFVAGNIGYFYGQQRIAMSTSTDNGVTWSSNESTPPIDLLETGRLKNYNTVGDAGFGLYDYFVTSGRGLYIPEDDILMYLIPAQTMTSATEHTNNSQDYIFYSRDGGESWYFSPQVMFAGGDEAKIIQKNDGSLLGSIRQGYNRGFNTATYTKNDDGKTLTFTMGSQWNNSQLSAGGYANNQDIFYYQRETVTGKTDVIFHSMTTGQHANFKLYYSTDGGANWTEFLTVQTKGTRYVTMERSGSEEDPGSLYLFFEDQSLNSAGGYTDYNHYPLNFLEITRDQLVALIPALEEYNVPEYLKTNVVKNTVYQTSTGCDSYGVFSGTGSGHWARTWTSNASSGVAGLTVSTESGYGFDKATILGTRVMTIRPSANGATDTYTITAPAGYVISSYSIGGAVYTGGTYRITAADGTTTGDITSTTTPTHITVNDVNASSTTFTFYGASQSNWFGFTNFTITLAKTLPLKDVGDKSYATLYLPFDVTTTGATKAYYVETASDGSAQLTATGNEGTEIPANTAVVLVNSDAVTSTVLNMTTGLSPVESANLLKGTLVPMSLDLSDATNYYSLGKLNDEIGFYKFSGGTITLGANKAYLETPAAGGPVKGFTFDFQTGINSMDDGRWTMGDVQIYNVAGQRMSRPQKGVNIVNGKKVVIK